jgi:hypothetical protein
MWLLGLAWVAIRLAWLERPPLHLLCRLLDCAFAAEECRRCGRPFSPVRDCR